MEPAATEASDSTNVSKPNWLWIGGLLTGLFAIHAAVGAFLCPIGNSFNPIHGINGIKLMLFIGTMGITLGQPSLLAIAAVFAPVRWAVRFTISCALVVLLAYATLWGIANNVANHRVSSGDVIVLLGLALGFLFSQIPLWAVRRFGHWRIVLPHSTTSSQSPSMSVSLRGLMLAVTVACVLAAIGQYTMRLVVWSEWTSIWPSVPTETIVMASLSMGDSLTIIPLIGMVLAVGGLRWYCLASLAAVMVAEAILLTSLLYFGRERLTTELVSVTTSLLAGAYFSGFISLLVVRACGFRLVREPATGKLANEHIVPTTNVAAEN